MTASAYISKPLVKRQDKALLWLKRGIWAYLLLLVFEGALRKWFVPMAFSPIVALIRDPLVLVVYWFAYRAGKLNAVDLAPIGIFAAMMTLLAALQVAGAITSLPVVLFGLRSYILHVPLIFVMQRSLTMDDIRRIGKFFLLACIPMTLLMVAQFRAESDSWLNAGANEGATQLPGSSGHVRASGTFSFITGVAEFFPIAEAFVIAEFLRRKSQWNYLKRIAGVCILLAIPISISRTFMFWSLFVFFAGIVSASKHLGSSVRLLRLLVVLAGVAVGLLQFPIFQDATDVFMKRWEEAKMGQDTSGVFSDRLLAPVTDAIEQAQTTPLLGVGLGEGSMFASAYYNRQGEYLVAENELIRVVAECGPWVGVLYLGYRAWLCFQLAYLSFGLTGRSVLPILLSAATIPNLIFQNMEQPTNLGFMIIGAGLAFACIAQLKSRPKLKRTSLGLNLAMVGEPSVMTGLESA